MAEQENVSQLLASFAHNLDSKAIPQSALHIMQLSIADWMSVSIRGIDEPVSKIVRDVTMEDGGKAEAFCFGSSKRLPAKASALVNGVTSHALDYDDTHFIAISHPSVAVIPAALAIADKVGGTANDFQLACLIGCEAACRMGAWLGRDHYRKGFHITSTSGTFGATLAAAKLLKFNKQKTIMALNIAASKASGVKAQFGTMGKPYHAGMAASAGVEAALLAQQGFVASVNAIDGSQGYAETHYGENNHQAFDGLGQNFVFENVSHKFHACCHGIHASLEALLALIKNHSLRADAIKAVTIETHSQWLDVCNIAEPNTGLEIKFSYAMAVALALSGYDTAKLETYDDTLCNDPALIKLRNKVKITGSPDISEAGTSVSVTLQDNTELKTNYDLMQLNDVKEREARVLSKAQSLLGEESALSLWASIKSQAELPSNWAEQIFHQ